MYEKLVYTATAGQTDFEVTFDYIHRKYLVVKVNGETKEYTTGYEVVGDNVVLVTPSTEGDIVVISRNTEVDVDNKPYLIKGRFTKDKLEKAFKYITHPVEESGEYSNGSDGASDTLDNLTNYSSARTNLGVSSKSEIDTSIGQLLGKSDNLSDLSNVSTARTNINTYSKLEALTKAEDAKDVSDNYEIDGVCISAGVYSPTIFQYTIDIYSDGIFRINQKNGSRIWINNGLYMFNYMQKTMTDMQWGVYYYIYLSVDEDGGFYVNTTTSDPYTAPATGYRGSRVMAVSNPNSDNPWSYDFFPFVGYVFGYGNMLYGRQCYHNPIVWNKNEQLWFQAWQEEFIP